jgi:hypothetical protein
MNMERLDTNIKSLITNKLLCPTHNIKQLGFSGLRGFCSRVSVLLGGYERAPKTQPFHIVNRVRPAWALTIG